MITKRAQDRAGRARQRTRRVAGEVLTQVCGGWKTHDGFLVEAWEGSYGGWMLYNPDGSVRSEHGSLEAAVKGLRASQALDILPSLNTHLVPVTWPSCPTCGEKAQSGSRDVADAYMKNVAMYQCHNQHTWEAP